MQAKQRLQQETVATYHQIRGSHPTDESLSSADNNDYDNDETTDESELFVPAEDKVRLWQDNTLWATVSFLVQQ